MTSGDEVQIVPVGVTVGLECQMVCVCFTVLFYKHSLLIYHLITLVDFNGEIINKSTLILSSSFSSYCPQSAFSFFFFFNTC